MLASSFLCIGLQRGDLLCYGIAVSVQAVQLACIEQRLHVMKQKVGDCTSCHVAEGMSILDSHTAQSAVH